MYLTTSAEDLFISPEDLRMPREPFPPMILKNLSRVVKTWNFLYLDPDLDMMMPFLYLHVLLKIVSICQIYTWNLRLFGGSLAGSAKKRASSLWNGIVLIREYPILSMVT